jgi:hypothetical protein
MCVRGIDNVCCFYDLSVDCQLNCIDSVVHFCFCFHKLNYYRCQQPINDAEEMNTEKDKEPQNEDVVKGDESKRRYDTESLTYI